MTALAYRDTNTGSYNGNAVDQDSCCASPLSSLPEDGKGGDMMSGEGLEMYTCSVLEAGSSIAEGAGTQMFTCSVLSKGSALSAGDATGLFTCSV